MNDILMIAKIPAIDGGAKIESPNDWLQKAGAHMKDGLPILPHDFLFMPMRIASKAVVSFRENTKYENRLEAAFLISLCIRSAEDSFFRKIAEMLNSRNEIKVCKDCIRNHLFDTDLKKFRNLCNDKIIHPKGESVMINPTDFNYAIQYYEEFFKLPLMDPVVWGAKKNIPICKNCLKVKNKIPD